MGISERPTAISRLAGLALLVAGASYLALLIILTIVSRGHLPESGQELLDYMVRHGMLVQVAMAAFILKDTCILIAFPILGLLLGMAIMSTREGLEFEGEIRSDTAPLNGLVNAILKASTEVHVMRDPTRGGLATTLNEIAS